MSITRGWIWITWYWPILGPRRSPWCQKQRPYRNSYMEQVDRPSCVQQRLDPFPTEHSETREFSMQVGGWGARVWVILCTLFFLWGKRLFSFLWAVTVGTDAWLLSPHKHSTAEVIWCLRTERFLDIQLLIWVTLDHKWPQTRWSMKGDYLVSVEKVLGEAEQVVLQKLWNALL